MLIQSYHSPEFKSVELRQGFTGLGRACYIVQSVDFTGRCFQENFHSLPEAFMWAANVKGVVPEFINKRSI